MFSTIRSAGRFLLTFVVTTATVTLTAVRRLATCAVEQVRLSRSKWDAARQQQRLGRELQARQRGDEDLLRQINSLEERIHDVTTNRFRRWLLRRRREVLLRRLADSTLPQAEPPPGVGSAYRDFRRALAAVAAARRRVAAAWAGLWPRERRDWLHAGLGTAVLAAALVGLALALRPSNSPPAVLPPEATEDRDKRQLAATPPTASPPAPATVEAHPDVPPDPTPTSGMTEKLDMDLTTDPRKDCQVHGSVEWERGRLTLGPDASLFRKLDLGSQAQLTLRLAFAPLAEDGQTSTTRFAFQVRDRGEFVVVLVRRRESGKMVSELRLVDQDTPLRGLKVTYPPRPGAGSAPVVVETPPRQKNSQTLRKYEWQGDFPEDPWTFRHHHGLVTVYCGEKRMGVAYADKAPGYYKDNPLRRSPANQRFYDLFGIDEPLEVSGWSLEQQGMSLGCTAVSGKASLSYRTTLASSFDENARAIARQVGAPGNREISDLRARIDHPIWADPEFFPLLLREWKNDYRRIMIGKCLGEHHPYYALVLHGGALQHQWGFKHDVAQQLLEKAVAVSEESLGDWHPDCLAVISSLGRLYREMGKFDRAESLLTKALKGTGEVYGSQSSRYSLALQDLARLLQYTNRLAEAETLLNRAVEVCKDSHPHERANAQMALSEVEVRLGEREKAAALLGKAQETLEHLAQEAWKNFEKDHRREHWLVGVDLADARVRRGWGLLREGQKDAARKLAREAFLPLVKFHGAEPTMPGRFQGWNSEMRNVLPNDFMISHPAYGRVMIRLADLFLTLGDYIPARSCVSLTDKVSLDITARRDAAVLYRTTAKLYERYPDLQLGYWVGHLSERQRLDFCIKSLYASNEEEERERQDYIAWIQSRVSKDNISEEEKKKWDATSKKLQQRRVIVPPQPRNPIQLTKVDIVGVWRHKPGNARPGEIKLLPNGKINNPNGKDLWTFAGTTLVLRWANKQAPGGFWIDTCRVSGDGKTYRGANQRKVVVTGEKIFRDNAKPAREKPKNAEPKVRKPDYALDWHKIAVREFEAASGPDHPETVGVLLNQARWEWRLYGPERARAAFRDAVNRDTAFSTRVLPGLPETQAYQYLEAGKQSLDLLLSCYLAANKDHARAAYEAVWHSKALATRQLMERWRLLQAASGGPEVKRLVAELQTTRQRLASLSLSPPTAFSVKLRQEQFAKLTRRKEDLERELGGLSESYRRTQDPARAGVADMVRRLPAKSAVVDLVERREWTPPARASEPWGQTRCYDAFVVRPAAGEPGWSVVWLTLGDADALDRLLNDWVTSLRSRRRTDRSQADELRRRLWTPIEAALTDCKTVVLVPDGRLAQVPWSALPGRRADSYLLEDYALAQAPYGHYVAHLLAGPAPEGDGLLPVGGIDYGLGGQWKPLPGTAAEVKQLEQLRPGSRTVRLGDETATKARLLELLADRRFVHLATHGEFLDPGPAGDRRRFQVVDRISGGAVFDVTARNPLLLSMLVLAGANRPVRTDGQGLPLDSDSFLTAEEVMGLDLRQTELVVLSACETGLGKVRGGEGVFSLQRAFHVSGSRAVMASLWQIPDKATQVLMQRFYENLWRKKMAKLESLREAQLWMLREGRRQPELVRGLEIVRDEADDAAAKRLPPYYWAAFVLSGDWR